MADKKSGLIDERGHTVADAEAQHPLLDASAKAASQEAPVGGGDVMVPAQTPAEVAAQVVNAPGAEGDEHDYFAANGIPQEAPLTDDMHGRDRATTAADRDDRAKLRPAAESSADARDADEG